MWLSLHWGEGVTCELWRERCWCWSGKCFSAGKGGHYSFLQHFCSYLCEIIAFPTCCISYLQHPDMRLWELSDSLEAQKPSNCSCPVCGSHCKTHLKGWAPCSLAGNWAFALGSGGLQWFFCKKLLKIHRVPNAELISVMCLQSPSQPGNALRDAQTQLVSFGKTSCDYLQERGEEGTGNTQLSAREKHWEMLHRDLPPKSAADRSWFWGWDGRIGQSGI